MSWRRATFVVAFALLAGSALANPAQDKVPSGALTMETFFERLDQHDTVFGEFRFLAGPEVQESSELETVVAQVLATNYSFLGRPNDAIRLFPIHDRRPSPGDLPTPNGFKAMTATDWIVAQLDRHQVVMVNEVHHKPQTRLLTLELLPRLRAAGFRYFAAETFGEAPMEAGYPTDGSGYYAREPVFAAIMRKAAQLGFILVPYEHVEAGNNSQQVRETGQAKRLAEVLARDPDARILVHAGYSHIFESPGSAARGANPMALEFTRLTGLPVLTVDQTKLTWEDGAAAERLARDFALASPSVLLDRSTDKAWSAIPELFDVSVALPSASPEALRPEWLSLGGVRQPVPVDTAPCIGHLPCLVAAYHASEGADAVPADQFVVLDIGELANPLYLSPGTYRLRLLGNDDDALVESDLVVRPSSAGTPRTKATP